MKVKSDAEIKSNYENSTADVPRRFEAGVRSAQWKDAAIDGQALYEEQMSKPEVLSRREKGLQRVSDEEWRNAAIQKGRNIIGARMKAASGKQVSRFAPYKAILESMDLPAKTSDPATNVQNRVVPIAVAFRNKKNEIG